jgi:4-hydroxybenzoate polyprenyltransferase
MRLHRPLPIFFLFYPCFFGLAISSESQIDWYLVFLFFLGSLIMRSAGCIINDLWDQDIDKKVERTKTRPLASGAISNWNAILILSILLSCGLLILLNLTISSILIAAFSMIFVVVYPLLKRFTYFPQLCLGLVWNIGLLVAHFNVANQITTPVVIAYIACIFWTIGYDTIYAFADIIDDKKIGIKSTAIFLQDKNPKFWIIIFYIIFILGMLVAVMLGGKFNRISPYFIAFCLLYRQVYLLDVNGNISNITLFQNNFWVGMLITIGLIV